MLKKWKELELNLVFNFFENITMSSKMYRPDTS